MKLFRQLDHPENTKDESIPNKSDVDKEASSQCSQCSQCPYLAASSVPAAPEAFGLPGCSFCSPHSLISMHQWSICPGRRCLCSRVQTGQSAVIVHPPAGTGPRAPGGCWRAGVRRLLRFSLFSITLRRMAQLFSVVLT